jgi:ribosomal protein S18 acetylase RimI-like enzyme
VTSCTGERRRSEAEEELIIYRYLSVLVVHPDFQKFRIGSRLLDQGLETFVTKDPKPALLEATPAGEKLYKSRGFVKEDEFTLAEQYPGMKGLKFPLYRRPADA